MSDEETRLSVLEAYKIMDTPPERVFDELVHMAARLLDVPIALISLLDEDRQWFKAKYGLDLVEVERDLSFCQYAIELDDTFIVPNAPEDARFVDNPLVTGELGTIRAYAGAPIRTPEGAVLGTLCVIDDNAPRTFVPRDIELLETLASAAVSHIETRRMLDELKRSRGGADEAHLSKHEIMRHAFRNLLTPATIIMGHTHVLQEALTGEEEDVDGIGRDLDTLREASELLLLRMERLLDVLDRRVLDEEE